MIRVRLSVRDLMGLVLVSGVLLAALGPMLLRGIESARQARCSANLRAIGLAMHQYHEKYGVFPPAFVADDEGRPMHSWRVLLLEFLDPALSRAYDFGEPWDGPRNRRLIARIPDVYVCPSHGGWAGTGAASYAVVAGPGTLFSADHPTTVADIIDGTSNTIMAVEAGNLSIPWTQPVDLRIDQMSFTIGDPWALCVADCHRGRGALLLADGTPVFAGRSFGGTRLRMAATIAGGELLTTCSY